MPLSYGKTTLKAKAWFLIKNEGFDPDRNDFVRNLGFFVKKEAGALVPRRRKYFAREAILDRKAYFCP
jgi:hypothetical protein